MSIARVNRVRMRYPRQPWCLVPADGEVEEGTEPRSGPVAAVVMTALRVHARMDSPEQLRRKSRASLLQVRC